MTRPEMTRNRCSSPLLLLLLFFSVVVFSTLRVLAGGLAGDEFIAHYRFDTNGNDSLGRGSPFVLTNVAQSRAGIAYTPVFKVTAPPFTNGVLYVNGLYEPNGHFINYLSTAPIKELRYESFTVAIDFYPLPKKRTRFDFNKLESRLDSWTRGRYARWCGIDNSVYNTENILTGGYFYRWIGFNRDGGDLNLTLNNQSFVRVFKGAAVKPGRWHNLICSVDLERRRILTMLDGRLLEPITLPADFKLEVIGSPEEAAERRFTFANYSNGSVFLGYAAHLKILKRALATEPELATLYDESQSVGERPKFPRPQFPWPTVILMTMIFAVAAAFLLFFFVLPGRRRRLSASQLICSPS